MRRTVGARAAAVPPIDRAVAPPRQVEPQSRALSAGHSDPLFDSSFGPYRPDLDRWPHPCCRSPQRPPTVRRSEHMPRSRKTGSIDIDDAYEKEVASSDEALHRDDFEAAFRHLERPMWPNGQRDGTPSPTGRMLVAGLRRGDLRDALGQVPRTVASILFSWLWVPRGTSGRARVSAFEPMSVPADLRHLVP